MDDNKAAEKATEEIEQLLRAESSRPRFPRTFLTLKPQEERQEPFIPEPVPESEAPLAIEKIDHTLLPIDALEEVSRTLMIGRDRHGAWNWVTNPLPYTHLLAKAERHILAFQGGENIDPGTGRSHIACAICDLLFLQSHMIQGVSTDDRFKR